MPWVYRDRDNGTSPRRNRRSPRRDTRSFDNRDDYADNEYDSSDNGSYGNGDDELRRGRGLYTRNGDPVRLIIQSPRDMLPPRRRATELPGDWNTVRSRARF